GTSVRAHRPEASVSPDRNSRDALNGGAQRKPDIEGGRMKLQIKIAIVTGVLALSASPAALAVGKPEGVPPNGKGASHAHEGSGPTYTPGEPIPGPKAGLPAKAKAYGRY